MKASPVQLAAVPVPTTRSGCDTSSERASCGISHVPAGLPAGGAPSSQTPLDCPLVFCALDAAVVEVATLVELTPLDDAELLAVVVPATVVDVGCAVVKLEIAVVDELEVTTLVLCVDWRSLDTTMVPSLVMVGNSPMEASTVTGNSTDASSGATPASPDVKVPELGAVVLGTVVFATVVLSTVVLSAVLSETVRFVVAAPLAVAVPDPSLVRGVGLCV